MTTATDDIPIPIDVRAAGPIVIGFYLHLIEHKGNSPRMAEMLALRQAPRVLTDDVIMAGRGTLADQLKYGPTRDYVIRQAIKHGYRPKYTDHYDTAIAAFPGDPAAFINHGQGRGHIKKTLEARGWESEGVVTTRGRQPEEEPKPKHKLHPRIVERIRRRKLKENPDLARKDQNEIRHEIVAKHGSTD